jgi:hypothetical protein
MRTPESTQRGLQSNNRLFVDLEVFRHRREFPLISGAARAFEFCDHGSASVQQLGPRLKRSFEAGV